MKKVIIITSIVLGTLLLGFTIFIGIIHYQNYIVPRGIRVTSISHKREYYIGDNYDGMNFCIELYANGRTLKELKEDEYEIRNFDTSKVGTYQVSVIYNEFSTTFTIEVKEFPKPNKVLKSIEMLELPDKLEYQVGEKLNLRGAILKLNYKDGTYGKTSVELLMTASEFMKNFRFTEDAKGEVEIRVYFENFKTSFKVIVK